MPILNNTIQSINKAFSDFFVLLNQKIQQMIVLSLDQYFEIVLRRAKRKQQFDRLKVMNCSTF